MVYTRAAVGGQITASMYNEHADELRAYVWTNGSARGFQTGMVKGEYGYQSDVDALYRYNGSAWSPWAVSRRTWTPTTVVGLDLTKGSLTCVYSVASGKVSYEVRGTATAAGFVTASVTITYPDLDGINLAPFLSGTSGHCDFVQAAAPTARNTGVIMQLASVLNPAVYNASGTYVARNALSGTVPFTWAVNDIFTGNGQYNL